MVQIARSQIDTVFVYPPIPIRQFDWCAYIKGEEDEQMTVGWGRTEEEAIADLIDALQDRTIDNVVYSSH